LTVFTVSRSVHPSCYPAGVMDELRLQFQLIRHQPAATWVNNTRYCKYSQLLLMMGENIAQNMHSRL